MRRPSGLKYAAASGAVTLFLILQPIVKRVVTGRKRKFHEEVVHRPLLSGKLNIASFVENLKQARTNGTDSLKFWFYLSALNLICYFSFEHTQRIVCFPKSEENDHCARW